MKVEQLLDFLRMGNAAAMEHFISSLEASGQQHVAQLILSEYLIRD